MGVLKPTLPFNTDQISFKNSINNIMTITGLYSVSFNICGLKWWKSYIDCQVTNCAYIVQYKTQKIKIKNTLAER